MLNKTQLITGAAALRDFFASINANDIHAAADSISRVFTIPLDPATLWIDVEYEFNRLFVGPAAVPAPPYASAYLNEPTLMGSPAMEMRNAYRRLGLTVPNPNATPDDHLSFELDAYIAIESLAQEDADGGILKKWLVCEHMNGWVPLFVEAVRRLLDVSAPITMAIDALSLWLVHAISDADALEA
ncbi:molecular chaperone TorD family protein [Desulfovibrio inopinatus]|uniref:molecular chaperone TorD family protein n=1 Tax=Desulfovibrio inopinatus TaxID=102109 RepID=UPI000423B191|nr:molecular chaperone TorD family protein [Desulfovibrio inopinatus]